MNNLQQFAQGELYYNEQKFGFIETDPKDWPQSFEFCYGSWNLIKKISNHITRYHKAFLVRRYTNMELKGGKCVSKPNDISTFKEVPYWKDLEKDFEKCLETGDFSSYPDDLFFVGENKNSWFWFWLDQDISDCAVAMLNKTCYLEGDTEKFMPFKTSLEEWVTGLLNPDISYFEIDLPSDFQFKTY